MGQDSRAVCAFWPIPPRGPPATCLPQEDSLGKTHGEMTCPGYRRGLCFGRIAVEPWGTACCPGVTGRKDFSFFQHPTNTVCRTDCWARNSATTGNTMMSHPGPPGSLGREVSGRKAVTTQCRSYWTDKKPRLYVSTSEQSLHQARAEQESGKTAWRRWTLAPPSIQLKLSTLLWELR